MARVLVIDDEDVVRDVVSDALREGGHQVMAVNHGKVGVAASSLAPFDLVITDILMPHMDGFDTIVALRERNPDVRILAISGGGDDDPAGYLRAARLLGAQRTLEKPFRIEELRQTVSDLLAPAAEA